MNYPESNILKEKLAQLINKHIPESSHTGGYVQEVINVYKNSNFIKDPIIGEDKGIARRTVRANAGQIRQANYLPKPKPGNTIKEVDNFQGGSEGYTYYTSYDGNSRIDLTSTKNNIDIEGAGNLNWGSVVLDKMVDENTGLTINPGNDVKLSGLSGRTYFMSNVVNNSTASKLSPPPLIFNEDGSIDVQGKDASVQTSGRAIIDKVTTEELMLANKKVTGDATIKTQPDGGQNACTIILKTTVTTRGGQPMVVYSELPVLASSMTESNSATVMNLDGGLHKMYSGFTSGVFGASGLGIPPANPSTNYSPPPTTQGGAPSNTNNTNTLPAPDTSNLPPPLFP